ncbi:MAG: MFS transporter, partial [Quisquiliibacterium sp.]
GAFSFGFLVSAVLSPMLGRMMDRSGPVVVMESGVLMMGAGLLLATLAREPWHIYMTLGLLVGGGSVMLGFTGQSMMLPAWFVRRRGLAIGIAFSGVGVGSILMLPLLQRYIEHTDWRAACWVLGLVVLVVLGPLNLLIRRRPSDLNLEPDGDPSAASAGAGAPARPSNIVDAQWAAVDWTLPRAIRTARFWWITSGYFACLYAWYSVQVHQTKYLIEIGFSTETAALALGVVSLAGVPGLIFLGHLSDRIGREIVWGIGCLGFVLTYLALLALEHQPSQLMLWSMVIAQGLLGYGTTAVVAAIPAEIFEGKQYGMIFGAVMLGAISGGALGPWLTGVLHDHTGSYALAFWIAILISIYGIIAIWKASPGKVRAVAGRIAKT